MEERRFFLTGTRTGTALAPVDPSFRPALFARFRDLATLRYDFPLVLLPRRDDGPWVTTLSALVDAVLREVAPRGIAGERLRRAVLRLEREIRALLAGGGSGTLSALWDRAAERLATTGGAPLSADLARARAALRADGELLDCGRGTAARFVTHAWRTVRERRRRETRRAIDALVVRLSDLVRADLLRSEAGRGPRALAAGVGAPHRDLFDFETMARLLAGPSGAVALPEPRRRRIEETLAVLRAQRFFGGDREHAYEFDRVDAALAAYRERLPEMAALVRALAVGELEVAGRYVETIHDAYFRDFDERSLAPEDAALFPDPLVRLDPSDEGGRAQLVDALASGAPLKIVLETDDPFGPGARLAASVMALGDVFVVQAPASHLARVAGPVLAALEYRGPTFASVFSGAIAGARGAPPYLVAAAALESRAFPSFAYDPTSGADWARRFSLEGDPQPEREWPVHELAYADERGQRVVRRVPFTPADLALCDPERAAHFAVVSGGGADGGLVPLGELPGGARDVDGATPCVYAVDGDDRLHTLVVDERLARLTRSCGEAWDRLRELDALKREHAPAPPAAGAPSDAAPAPATGAGVTTSAAAAVPAEDAAAPARSPDDPYIETPRCATCNECTNINPRLFKYDANRQAYLADLTAGTYRDLVEAAESCQVAIIHPGKPRDPNEPGLADLIQRAEAFR